ncbi:MAG: hypothetical protein K6F53_02595 [Lachnospiraceae bacterium]|nr:hypothetical protein [Lachnospiraceae bacterium]
MSLNTKANGKGKNYGTGISFGGLSAKNGSTVTLYVIWRAKKFNISYVNVDPSKAYDAAGPASQLQNVTNKSAAVYNATKTFSERVTSIPVWTTGNVMLYGKWDVK